MRPQFFSRNSAILYLHIVVISLLLAVSLWDIYHIVDDFVNDNRLTVVKTEDVNGTFPFLRNLPVTLEIAAFSAIFPELWSRSTVYDYHALGDEFLKNGSKTLNYFSLNQSLLEDRVNTVLLFRHLELMDTDAALCILEVDPKRKANCDAIQSYAHFDPVLQNRTFIESLQETGWNQLKHHLIGAYSDISDDMPGVSLSYYSDADATIEIDTFAVLSKQNSSFGFYAGAVGSKQWFEKIRNTTSAHIEIELKIQDFNSGHFKLFLGENKRIRITLNIENIGIYDKTLTTRCNAEPEIFAEFNEKNCRSKNYLSIIAKKCNCLPFSLRKKAQKSLAFCTSTTYAQCIRNLRIIDEECLPNCVTIKNLYSVTSANDEQLEYMVLDVDGYAFLKGGLGDVEIRCSSSNYAVYEERLKLSPNQFISQIGGDIGLYLGLSALSVWHFIVVVIFGYCSQPKSTNGNGGISSLRNIGLIGCCRNESKDAPQNHAASTARTEIGTDDLKQRVLTVESEVRQINSKLSNIESAVLQLKNVIAKQSSRWPEMMVEGF